MRLLAAFAMAGVLAASPVIREVHPRGAQRGKTFTLHLRGEGLLEDAKLETTLPAGFSRLVSSKEPAMPNAELPFLVELKSDTPVGLYPIRVVTRDGLSNVVLFSVGELPEAEENESQNPKQRNDSFDKAEPLSAPVTINGTLGPADVDCFSVTAKPGQKLVFEIEARRAGSAIDPAIEVLDASGKEVARNDDAPGLGVDARVEVAFTKPGPYRVRVHDSRYSDQAVNFYRLKVASYSYAEGLFPLGWRRGEPVEVTLVGGNLTRPVTVRPGTAVKSPFVPVHVPGSAVLPLLFALSDSPEAIEPASAEPPLLQENVVMNGRLSKPGEKDRYRVRVSPGEKWMFELTAASLGTSQLDALLTVLDSTGRQLATRDDAGGIDPAVPLTVPGGVREVTVVIEDLLGRGGATFAYRLTAHRQPPDFTLMLLSPFVNVPAGGTAAVAVQIQRRGYDGALRLKIPNLPPGFKVAGGHVPPESAAQRFTDDRPGFHTERSVLTITAGAEVPSQTVELDVVGEADMPDGKIVRHADGPGLVVPIRGERQRPVTAAWLGMKLPMSAAGPQPFTLEVSTPLARFAQGFEWPLEYRIRRRAGASAALKVNQQIAGAVGNLRILRPPAPKPGEGGVFLVNTNFATPTTTFDMIVDAQAEIDGIPVTITAPAVSVTVVPGYEIRLADPSLEVAPGAPLEIRGRVRREPTFEGGTIRLQAEDLPEHVACEAAEAPAEGTEFTIRCAASPAAKPGSYEIRIVSAAPDTGRKAKAEYKIPDLTAKLKVAGAAQAATR